MKNKIRTLKRVGWAALIALLLVLAWYGQSRVLAPWRCVRIIKIDAPASLPDTEQKSLRVAAFNIAHGRGGAYGAGNWTGLTREEIHAHLKLIADQVQEAEVDIVVLNEVDFQSTWSRGIDQAQAIANYAGFAYCVEQRSIDAALPFLKFRFGNAILSKYPLRDAQVLRFAALSKKERAFAGNHDSLLATVETPLGDLRILAVHFYTRSEDVRVECARSVLSMMEEEELPLIALGDYNSTPSDYPNHRKSEANENAMDLLLDSELLAVKSEETDAEHYLTFPSASPKMAIDWILSTPGIVQEKVSVIESDLSDHLMVTAQLSIAKRE